MNLNPVLQKMLFLVICSRDCLAVGVESCPVYSDEKEFEHLPIYNLHRKSEAS